MCSIFETDTAFSSDFFPVEAFFIKKAWSLVHQQQCTNQALGAHLEQKVGAEEQEQIPDEVRVLLADTPGENCEDPLDRYCLEAYSHGMELAHDVRVLLLHLTDNEPLILADLAEESLLHPDQIDTS